MASQINFKGNIDLIYKIQKFIKAKRICDNVLQQIEVNLIDQKTEIQEISKKGDEYLKQQIQKEMPNKTIEQLIIIPTSIMTYSKEVAYPLDIANIHFGILVDGFPAIVSDTIIIRENKLHPNFRKYNGLRNNINQIIGKITELLKPGIRSNYLDLISRKVAQEHGCELIGDTLIYKVHQPFTNVQSGLLRQEEVIKLNETYNLTLCLSFEKTDQNEFADFQFADFIRADSGSNFYSKRQVFLFSATYFILKNGPTKICGFPDTNFKDTKALHQISNQIAKELFERMKQLISFLQKRMGKIIETIEVLRRKQLVREKLNQYNLLFQQVKHQIIRVRESMEQTITKHNIIQVVAQQIKPIIDSFFKQLDILEQGIQVFAQNFDKNNIKEKKEKQKQQLSEIKLKNYEKELKIELRQSFSQNRECCFTVKKRSEMNQYDIKMLDKICSNNINIFNFFAGTQGNPETGLLYSDFDPKHNRKWNSGRQIIERRGPSYHPYYYYFPMGYFGYALNVKDKYWNYWGNQKWLDRYGDDEEWRILYYGTKHENLKNIVKEGPQPGGMQSFQYEECEMTKKKVGKGVYFSDRVEVCEKYAPPTEIGGKKYILLFQLRVNPRAIRQSYCMQQLSYFVVNESKDIRPYRILIKEIS